MSRLKPGVTYVYERVDNCVYARESGTSLRILIGRLYDSDSMNQRQTYLAQINAVIEMSYQHDDMKQLLEQLFLLYNLRRTHEPE